MKPKWTIVFGPSSSMPSMSRLHHEGGKHLLLNHLNHLHPSRLQVSSDNRRLQRVLIETDDSNVNVEPNVKSASSNANELAFSNVNVVIHVVPQQKPCDSLSRSSACHTCPWYDTGNRLEHSDCIGKSRRKGISAPLLSQQLL